MWVVPFPAFADPISLKHCAHRAENDDDFGNEIQDGSNIYENEGSSNVHRLMDVSVFEVTRLGSGPDGKGPNCPRRPNAYIKQRHAHTRHKKYHGLSVLTISFPNRMNTVADVVSTRNWDGSILTWSDLENILCNLCANKNIPVYSS